MPIEIVAFSAFISLLTLILSTYKDLIDIRGDRHDGIRTLPVKFGIQAVRRTLAFSLLGCAGSNPNVRVPPVSYRVCSPARPRTRPGDQSFRKNLFSNRAQEWLSEHQWLSLDFQTVMGLGASTIDNGTGASRG
jgi:hypothetical protein